MSDLMVDIETLDTKSTAVVLSIGMVWFDRNDYTITPYDGKHIRLIAAYQQDTLGRTVGVDTVMWWLQQSEEARRAVYGDRVTEYSEAMGIVQSAVKEADTIWAKGPDFDCTILASLFKDIKWPFWKNRDVRTYLDMARYSSMRSSGLVAHNALDDAIQQANDIRAATELLRRGNNVAN